MIVYKHSLHPQITGFRSREGYRVLKVDVQQGQPYLWTLEDPGKPPVDVFVAAFPTGVDFDADGLEHIGSATGVDGFLVFHFFLQKEN